MIDNQQIEELLHLYDRKRHDFRIFMEGVVQYIGEHPDLNAPGHACVHSYKSRLKNRDHLRDKLKRKIDGGTDLTPKNFFNLITDLSGVRILHLFQGEFSKIDKVIRTKVEEGDWYLSEVPKAYTWDPDSVSFFKRFDLDVIQKPTSYTSVHYLVRPRVDSPICCEVQVRTLFEEIWGEVDHRINYPKASESVACREQIAVLSKLVGAGSRLLDSLDRVQGNEPAVKSDSLKPL